MRAAYVEATSKDNPLGALRVGEFEPPAPPDGFRRVRVVASALNRHDLFSLQGVGLPDERLPMVLGCDAAGIDDDGRSVIVHSVLSSPGWEGDETLDPQRSLLSERYPGTMADYVWVPERNLVPKPEDLSFEEAACLPTAWLTAYRMLFTRSDAAPGSTVLVQGAGGGVSTALIALGAAAGYRMWVTSRDEAKRARALELGAEQAFESGARLPERVDAVMETVGKATWEHSIKVLRPGGTIVISGATSGPDPPAALTRLFFLQLNVHGSTMGTLDELRRLIAFCDQAGVKPLIDASFPLDRAGEALARLASGDVFGKLVLTR